MNIFSKLSYQAVCLATALSVAISTTFLPAAANAKLVETETLLQQQILSDSQQKVSSFLERDDVIQKLEAWGVSPEEARSRVATLSDSEAQMLAMHIEELPAGQGVGALIGAVVFIFVVLLITDILGFTKVYPFTR